MNTLRGLGACAVLAGIAYTVTKVTQVDIVVLGFTCLAVTVTLVSWMLSIKRRRHDRRAAGSGRRARRT
ncbi:hypothetical protein [Streptomyces griseomycini]|uniref:Uncharacterized protein n=1 Tax=Streptomyces griseomycini TaxID=66895 RepID=A0A7W7PQE6_9ACTN|nr:hypothetical protein [Streptomyces griseomycini]MBB4897543.1 hypothetical protein [Streptomyces griseomycini]GGP90598.1 hypothetical protein GCM10010266_11540 [Streptomyces griseomycini]GGR13077.1 hypothetical protein GCM10015536_18500 [Streptomyces griseomycini]